MKILFVHPNFPAQFKHIAKAAAFNGHDVYFMCQTHYGRTIEGVKRLKLKGIHSFDALEEQNLKVFEKTKYIGEQFRAGFVDLKGKSWNPDIVISHSGWGCGMYIKEVWPLCNHIAYLEWWFNPTSDFFLYDEENKSINLSRLSIKKNYERNIFVSIELSSADAIVSPTFWQQSQLPTLLKKSCQVIFDGIDLKKFQVERKKNHPKITYGTRGMDPMRGFPQFIKSIPEILSSLDDEIDIEIAGDEKSYYGLSPKGFVSWKDWALKFLEEKNVSHKVIWRKFMPLSSYIQWLNSSWCHVYLTHPFVASWSLVEALAAEIPIVASKVTAVEELCGNCDGVKLIDHRSTENIVTAVSDTIKEQYDDNPKKFRRNLSHLSVKQSLERWGVVAGVELTTGN